MTYPLKIRPVEWINGKVRWLLTNLLPYEERYEESEDYERIAKAIESMEIRGAPAIGVAAALAVAAAVCKKSATSEKVEEVRAEALKAIERLRRTRPTAYNLFWALARMEDVVMREYASVDELRRAAVTEATKIMREDVEANVKIGELGERFIEDGDTVLTHCNAGALATAGFGTALAIIRVAWYRGKKVRVIATETRPLLQGARLTVWELVKEGIPVTLITDNMVGYVMWKGLVDKVIVGADRVLSDGHVINKVGTYTIAALAKMHGVPFYVAAPSSSIDMKSQLKDVIIEERDPNEVRTVLGRIYVTISDVPVLNPAFDVTPPEFVSAIITERGIAYPPYKDSLSRLFGARAPSSTL